MDTYPIYFSDEIIGDATVMKQGLFYRIHCVCDISGSVPFRITAKGDREADLGSCVPMDDRFGLKTSIPISKVGSSQLRFEGRPKHTDKIPKGITVSPDEPFQYLSKLKDAYLVCRNEVAFKEKSLNLPDNDPNP